MSSRYQKQNQKGANTSLMSLWKYVGACANPKGHLLNSHFPDGVTKADFGPDPYSKQDNGNHFS